MAPEHHPSAVQVVLEVHPSVARQAYRAVPAERHPWVVPVEPAAHPLEELACREARVAQAVRHPFLVVLEVHPSVVVRASRVVVEGSQGAVVDLGAFLVVAVVVAVCLTCRSTSESAITEQQRCCQLYNRCLWTNINQEVSSIPKCLKNHE